MLGRSPTDRVYHTSVSGFPSARCRTSLLTAVRRPDKSSAADGAASNNGHDMLETMKFAALIHPAVGAGILSSERILEMATIDGARALGLDDEVGSLEAGKKADVMVIGRRGKPHLSPGLKPVPDVVFCANGSDVDTVVVGDGCGDERRPWTLRSLRSMIG